MADDIVERRLAHGVRPIEPGDFVSLPGKDNNDLNDYDIVGRLRNWAYIIDQSQGQASVLMVRGDVFTDAADEIKRLRQRVNEQADTITWLESQLHRSGE